MSIARALFWLTVALIRRLLREPQVTRSLLSPPLIAIGTMVLTAMVSLALNRPTPVAVHPQVPPEVVTEIAALGFETVTTASPEAAVRDGSSWAGVGAASLHIRLPSPEALQIESVMRRHLGARWHPAPTPPPDQTASGPDAGLLTKALSVLFVLYGVVFGAGMVARDNDEGTLEAEQTLPFPWWIHGASRWLAGSVVLSLFLTLSNGMLYSFVGVDDVGAVTRNGIAACIASVAVGLGAIGRGGLKAGFSGPLSAGLTAVVGLLALGSLLPIGWALPIASLLSDGNGWLPLPLSVVLGTAAIGLFHWQLGRS